MRALLVFAVLTAIFPAATLAADSPDAIAVAYGRCTDTYMKPNADPAAGVAACREAAEAGVPGAQYAMAGALLELAHGESSPEAVQWLERAVASGHAGASYLLARLIGATDRQRANSLFRAAVCGESQAALADLQKHGVAFDRSSCPRRPLADFSGEWSGRLGYTKPIVESSGGPELKVVFNAGSARVYAKIGDAWMEVKPGKFTVSQLGETVVVSALDSGSDFDGKWIETWSLTFLRLTESESVVNYIRTVNNRDMPATFSWRTFTTIAEGRMKRTTATAASR